MIEAGKDEDTIDHDLISLPDLDSEEQDSDRLNRTTTDSIQIANSVPIIDDFDNQSSEIEIDPAKTAGRWTKGEHELFLQGIKLHSKQWKMVAKVVKTRTVVQVRTHAQKYFQKLEKIQNRKAGKVPSKASSGKLGESDSISSSKSSCTDDDHSDAEKSGNGKSIPKAPSSSVKRQQQPGTKLTSAATASKDNNNASQLIMRTQSMSAIDQNSKLPPTFSGANIGMQNNNNKATPHLLQFGPQKRAREDSFPSENNVLHHNMMFYQLQYSTTHSTYISPTRNNSYASPTKTNVHAMNRCYTYDNWDTSSSSRMHSMYDTTIAGSDEVNDQALISMLSTIDWTSHSRSPEDNTTTTAPAIVPESGRCSPLNPITSVSNTNEDGVEIRKPIASHINYSAPTITLGQQRSDEVVSTERNSSISASSDDTSALLAASTTDEDISTSSTSYDSKFTTSCFNRTTCSSSSSSSSPSERKNDSNPWTTQPDKRQEVPPQNFLKFSLFRGYGHGSISEANNQCHTGQGYLATAKGSENLLPLPHHALDPCLRNAAHMIVPSSAAFIHDGSVRSSFSRSSSDSFDALPDGASPMKHSYYSPLDCSQQKFCQSEVEILRSVSSTDELNHRMPSLSIISSGQKQIETTTTTTTTTSKSPAKRRGRPRKTPITPARSTSTFTSYNNSNSKPGPNAEPSIHSPNFPSLLTYVPSAHHSISPIPELSPTVTDQNDAANEKCNVSSSPSFNELLVGIDSGSGSGDHRNAVPSPFSAAAAALDVIRAPRSDLTAESASSSPQIIREEEEKEEEEDFGYFSHCDNIILHDMNIATQDLETNSYCKMEEDMFIGSDVFEVFDAPLPLNYKF